MKARAPARPAPRPPQSAEEKGRRQHEESRPAGGGPGPTAAPPGAVESGDPARPDRSLGHRVGGYRLGRSTVGGLPGRLPQPGRGGSGPGPVAAGPVQLAGSDDEGEGGEERRPRRKRMKRTYPGMVSGEEADRRLDEQDEEYAQELERKREAARQRRLKERRERAKKAKKSPTAPAASRPSRSGSAPRRKREDYLGQLKDPDVTSRLMELSARSQDQLLERAGLVERGAATDKGERLSKAIDEDRVRRLSGAQIAFLNRYHENFESGSLALERGEEGEPLVTAPRRSNTRSMRGAMIPQLGTYPKEEERALEISKSVDDEEYSRLLRTGDPSQVREATRKRRRARRSSDEEPAAPGASGPSLFKQLRAQRAHLRWEQSRAPRAAVPQELAARTARWREGGMPGYFQSNPMSDPGATSATAPGADPGTYGVELAEIQRKSAAEFTDFLDTALGGGAELDEREQDYSQSALAYLDRLAEKADTGSAQEDLVAAGRKLLLSPERPVDSGFDSPFELSSSEGEGASPSARPPAAKKPRRRSPKGRSSGSEPAVSTSSTPSRSGEKKRRRKRGGKRR